MYLCVDVHVCMLVFGSHTHTYIVSLSHGTSLDSRERVSRHLCVCWCVCVCTCVHMCVCWCSGHLLTQQPNLSPVRSLARRS